MDVKNTKDVVAMNPAGRYCGRSRASPRVSDAGKTMVALGFGADAGPCLKNISPQVKKIFLVLLFLKNSENIKKCRWGDLNPGSILFLEQYYQ